MNLNLTKKQEMIVKVVREFAENEVGSIAAELQDL